MRSDKFGSQLERKSKSWFFIIFPMWMFMNRRRQNSDLTTYTFKILVLCTPELMKEGHHGTGFSNFQIQKWVSQTVVFDILLMSAKNCKKDTIFDNLRTINQEGGMKTRFMTPFFSSAFRALTVKKPHFCILNLSKFIFLGHPFVHSGLQNTWILEVKAVRLGFCPIRFKKDTHWEKWKNQVLLFLLSGE